MVMQKIAIISCLLLVHTAYAQLDPQGWTVLTPASGTKILYVSTAQGNDATARVYFHPAPDVGNDPTDPDQAVAAYRSIEAAIENVADGEAAWILLKKGDTFTESITPFSGSSANAPVVYSAYGRAEKRPLLKTGTKPGIKFCCGSLRHFYVVGLDFYAHTRDPANAAYAGNDGDVGFKIETKTGVIDNILLEDNSFRFYNDQVVQALQKTGKVTRVTIRRNVIVDNYDERSISVGLFAKDVDELLLEENVFDHNGWLIPSSSDGEVRDEGQATMFNHNTYFVDARDVVFRGNSFNRPSSIGTKWVAKSGQASTRGIVVENNLFNDCEFSVSMGDNFPEDSYRFEDIQFNNNVLVHPGRSDPTRRQLAWGVLIDDWSNGSFSDNLMIHQPNAASAAFGVRINGETRNLDITNNIFYDLRGNRGIQVETTSLQNVRVSSNEFTYFTDFDKYVEVRKPLSAGITFFDNQYTVSDEMSRPFRIESTNYSLAGWRELWSQEDATGEVQYPDARRNLDTYIAEVLKLPNRERYYQELRKQSKDNWREAYTATAINAWIKAGYRATQDGVSAPVPDVAELPDLVGNCSVDAPNPPTATDVRGRKITGDTETVFPTRDKKLQQITWTFSDTQGNTAVQTQKVRFLENRSNVTIERQGSALNVVGEGSRFMWFNCDDLRSILGQGRSFTPLTEGTYAVKAKQDDCYTRSDCVTYGINQPDAITDILISPNPAANTLHVRLQDDASSARYSLQVVDVSGEVLMTRATEATREVLDISRLTPGVYFLRVRHRDKVTVQRFAKP